MTTEPEPMAASSETGRIHPSLLYLFMTMAHRLWAIAHHQGAPGASGASWAMRLDHSTCRLDLQNAPVHHSLVAGLAPSYRACSGPACSSLSLNTRDMPTGDQGQATRPWRMTIVSQAWP